MKLYQSNPPNQVGYDMTRQAAKKCFETAGLAPSDVNVIELHDCFSANELITYEALGLCKEGVYFGFCPALYLKKYDKTTGRGFLSDILVKFPSNLLMHL